MAVLTTGSKAGPQFSAANWAPIPAWEQATLKQLSAQGKLSGVPPEYLAAIAQAESNGIGGGINSSNYGGFFGLAPNTAYPNGSLTMAQLLGTDKASFSAQAETAAAAYASYLKAANGNAYAAEMHYQGGRTQGVGVMQSYGLGPNINVASLTSPPSLSSSSLGGSLMGTCNKKDCLVGTPFGVGGCLLDQCQARALVSGLVILGGGLVILVGVAVLASSSSGGKQLLKLAPVAYGADKLGQAMGPNKRPTEKQAQQRELSAYTRGHSEGRTMAEKGRSVPKQSSTFTPHPDDADFSEEPS